MPGREVLLPVLSERGLVEGNFSVVPPEVCWARAAPATSKAAVSNGRGACMVRLLRAIDETSGGCVLVRSEEPRGSVRTPPTQRGAPHAGTPGRGQRPGLN